MIQWIGMWKKLCCDLISVQYGMMEVTNHKSLQKSVVDFKACGWFGNDLHKIEGFLLDKEWVDLTLLWFAFDIHKRLLWYFWFILAPQCSIARYWVYSVDMETIKRQIRATYGFMATGQSLRPWTLDCILDCTLAVSVTTSPLRWRMRQFWCYVNEPYFTFTYIIVWTASVMGIWHTLWESFA